MRKDVLITLLLLVVIVAGLSFWAYSVQQQNRPAPAPSSAESALRTATTSGTFTNLDGEVTGLDAYTGSIIVAHAWASWVPSSPDALRELAALQREYPTESVVVLAINRSEPPATAKLFLEQIEQPDLTYIIDQTDHFFQTVGGRTMPETVLYDRNGDVAAHLKGPLSIAELRREIETIQGVGE